MNTRELLAAIDDVREEVATAGAKCRKQDDRIDEMQHAIEKALAQMSRGCVELAKLTLKGVL